MKEIAIICGTRPEFIKLFPLYNELKDEPNIKVKFFFTGQHNLIFSEYGVGVPLSYDNKIPDLQDLKLPSRQSKILLEISMYFDDIPLDYIIVQGDTLSAFSGALYGFQRGIPVIHIEAGLRTESIKEPFPEEGYRRMISRIATYHFCPTDDAKGNLHLEGITDNTYVVGNTGIDMVDYIGKTDFVKEVISEPKSNFAIITTHRRENWDKIQQISEEIQKACLKSPSYKFLWILPQNPEIQIKVKDSIEENLQNLLLTAPCPYIMLQRLLQKCRLLITDSGGLQEEACYLDISCFVLRKETEREEGIISGGAKLIEDFNNIVPMIENFVKTGGLNMEYKDNNVYGDGKASKKIVKILKKELDF